MRTIYVRSLVLIIILAVFGVERVQGDCAATNLNLIPLPDLGMGQHKGFTGGLYPNGGNRRPGGHEAAGMSIASNRVVPRLLSGSIDTNNGKIVLLSIGMSNTTQEWATRGSGAFKPRADTDLTKNPQVVIVDGAQGGMDSITWTNRNAQTWSNVLLRLGNAGVSSNQVQVAWVKLARASPWFFAGDFPAHAQSLQADLEHVVRNLKSWFPNIEIVFLSSRTRCYETNRNQLNPEPFAYESGFSVKWMIEKQLNGDASLNYDTDHGPVVAPLLSWGPYLWTDGLRPRSDGFTWDCNDLTNDFTHPSENGVRKVGDQLLAFFKTDPFATPWFLRQPTNTTSGAGVAVLLPATNNVPFTAVFTNSFSGAKYWWTFGDGTFSTNSFPTKAFTTPGSYTARLLIQNGSANWWSGNVQVQALLDYPQWAQMKFTPVEFLNTNISARTADPDGDHIANYMEYRMGLEPKSANGVGRGFTAQVINDVLEVSIPSFEYYVWENSGTGLVWARSSTNVTIWPQEPRSAVSSKTTFDLPADEGLTTRRLFQSDTAGTSFIKPRMILGP